MEGVKFGDGEVMLYANADPLFFVVGVGAMDGATIRGLKFFIETYGAIGMLFDVEIMTKSGRLARLGTGRFAEFEGGL